MSVTAANGFEAGGMACGIKGDGVLDLALVATTDRRRVPAAAVFTTNLVQAAPVQVGDQAPGQAEGQVGPVAADQEHLGQDLGDGGRVQRLARRRLAAAALERPPVVDQPLCIGMKHVRSLRLQRGKTGTS